MTHDELLQKIKIFYERKTLGAGKFYIALRAVVELHKPCSIKNSMIYCEGCSNSAFFPWDSCPTIQAIEEQLVENTYNPATHKVAPKDAVVIEETGGLGGSGGGGTSSGRGVLDNLGGSGGGGTGFGSGASCRCRVCMGSPLLPVHVHTWRNLPGNYTRECEMCQMEENIW